MEFNDNRYIDREARNVITTSLLNKMVIRSLFLQSSFNYERMQGCGFLYSIIPGLEVIHKNKDDLKKSMKLHMEFFNTHPFLVTFIQGMVIAMEENKEDIDTIRGIKVATMGPLGGIGDSIFWLTVLPIAAGLGASLALQGQVAGPIIFLVIYNAVQFGLRYSLMHYGYKTGVSAIKQLKENTQKFARAATIVGLTVVGALIASYINIKLALTITAGEAVVNLQESIIDSIMPKLLPVLYTFGMLYLVKKKFSPIYLVAITLLLGVVGTYIGLF